MRALVCVIVFTIGGTASADPRAMMMMQGAWLQGRIQSQQPPQLSSPSRDLLSIRPIVRVHSVKPRPKPRPKQPTTQQTTQPTKQQTKQPAKQTTQQVRTAGQLKAAWVAAQQQQCTAGSGKTCNSKRLTALVTLCKSLGPDGASRGCRLGAIAKLVTRVKKLAARGRERTRRLAAWFRDRDRPVAEYTAAIPGHPTTQIQAGLLLTPLRMGMPQPVSPRTLELLHAARLITELEYRVVRGQLLGY